MEWRDVMLTKDKSDILKGIAAILMLAHHLFGFPGWVITFLIIGFCVKEPMPNLAVYWPGKSYLIFIWTFGLLFVICYAVSKVTGKALDNISKLIK